MMGAPAAIASTVSTARGRLGGREASPDEPQDAVLEALALLEDEGEEVRPRVAALDLVVGLEAVGLAVPAQPVEERGTLVVVPGRAGRAPGGPFPGGLRI